jgi:hypothetical protein
MIFAADIPESLSTTNFTIQDETDGYRGEAHVCLAQPTPSTPVEETWLSSSSALE